MMHLPHSVIQSDPKADLLTIYYKAKSTATTDILGDQTPGPGDVPAYL
jgi:hypothetical protein